MVQFRLRPAREAPSGIWHVTAGRRHAPAVPDRTIRDEEHARRRTVASSLAETKRYFDIIAEALRDDIRLFAEALASHTDRRDRHDARIATLERRSI
jgi:hypothetical protein